MFGGVCERTCYGRLLKKHDATSFSKLRISTNQLAAIEAKANFQRAYTEEDDRAGNDTNKSHFAETMEIAP